MVKHGTRIFATILSEIDKAPCQIVYHMYSRGNPRHPCGKSWPRNITVVPVAGCHCGRARRQYYASVLQNNMQVHEMTHSTWSTVVPYFHKLTA